MKSLKKLEAIYNQSKKGDNQYITFDSFLNAAKAFKKLMFSKQWRGRTVCGLTVSRSGMSRQFNFDNLGLGGDLNLLFNICYNKKRTYAPVKVGGCGMDMHWHLKFTTCEMIFTKKEIEKHNLNYLCSSGSCL